MVKNGQRPIHDVRFEHPQGPGALVEVVRLTELRARSLEPSIYTSQRRDFHMLQLVTRGKGRHHFDFGSTRLSRGDVFHIRPGQVDWFDERSDHDALLVVFVPEAIPDREDLRVRLSNPLRPPRTDFARLEAIAHLIEDFQTHAHLRGSVLFLLRSLVRALQSLHSMATATSPSAAAKASLCERLEQLLAHHLRDRRDVAFYADRLGVSAKTLARATTELLGMSPKQRIDGAVVLEAKRLLVHSDLRVDEIASTLGFSEPTNFVKFFRRVTETTPQQFRNQAKQH